jgi:type III secretion system YscI/HrpB-like protein
MNTVITPDLHINAVAAPSQMQQVPASSSQGARQFQQALINHLRADTAPADFIKDGIAAIEQQENALTAAMAGLADPAAGGMSSASLVAMQSRHLQMTIAYQATARVIGMTAQNITELMRMQ